MSAGGALGAAARYGIGLGLGGNGGGFPFATLLVNLSGSLALGLVLTVLLERSPRSRYWRAFLGTGLCGAYSTTSAFAVDTDLLVRDGRLVVVAVYVSASVIGGLVAVWAGKRLGGVLSKRRVRHPI